MLLTLLKIGEVPSASQIPRRALVPPMSPTNTEEAAATSLRWLKAGWRAHCRQHTDDGQMTQVFPLNINKPGPSKNR